MKYVAVITWTIAVLLSLKLALGDQIPIGCSDGCSVVSKPFHGIPAFLSLAALAAICLAYIRSLAKIYKGLTLASLVAVFAAVSTLSALREWCSFCVALQICYVMLFLIAWMPKIAVRGAIAAAYCGLALFAAVRAEGPGATGTYEFGFRKGDPAVPAVVLFADPMCHECHRLWGSLSPSTKEVVAIRWRLIPSMSAWSERIAAICECVRREKPEKSRIFIDKVLSDPNSYEDGILLKLARDSGVDDVVNGAMKKLPDWADELVATDGMLATSLGITSVPAPFKIEKAAGRIELHQTSQSYVRGLDAKKANLSQEEK